ncbi:MAG TPA: hypothetical protein VFQ45_03130 [Longimicrobium sp.]|nr:hypothetical protein [Longimicrobium sp.]
MPALTHEQLAALSPRERESALEALESELLGSGLPQAGLVVEARLRAFEERFGMSTDEMLKRFASGALAEDDDISSWLFWASVAKRTRVAR